MGQQQSRPHQTRRQQQSGRAAGPADWWDALRLGLVTVAVGAVQLLRHHLVSIEDGQHASGQHRRHQRSSGGHASHRPGVASTLSPETRRALVELIDYQVTPLLVDQWRLGLVKVMLDPEEGPVLPDRDPHMRQAVLASLKEAEAARSRQHHQPQQRPAAAQPQRFTASHRSAATPVASSSAGPSGSAVLSEHRPAAAAAADARPSAPPLSVAEPPSAPPLTASPAAEAAGPSTRADSEEPDPDGCGICMDAPVEVQVDGCRHRMCCECAKAICCLEGRAPQCPFCRGPMTGVSAIPSP